METGGRAREIGEWDSQVRRRSTSDRWIIRTARIVGKGKQQMALGPRWGVRITPHKLAAAKSSFQHKFAAIKRKIPDAVRYLGSF